tara:strand:- start:585 stop:1502 length:918 start_codon:yes stop_codon:yes gene_type:complete
MAGRYVLGEEWAQGGMARVFRGELRGSKGFSRPVAIKRMLPALGDDPEFARLFVEEARVVSVLSHPNIVSVLDLAVDEDERLCIVMEWVEGVDMGTWRGLHARSGARTEWEHVARVGLHVARALAAAHERPAAPVFHRDVTPTNILLSTQGIAKLVDFGLARAGDRATLTNPGVLKGKLPYMAPELQAGQRASAATDLYSLGLTLWEALAMQRPFDGLSTLEILVQAGKGAIPRLETLRDDLPEGFADIVHRLCARVPGDRPESARETIGLLSAFTSNDRSSFEKNIREFTEARDTLRAAHTNTP